MIDDIVKYTNKEICRQKVSYSADTKFTGLTDATETRALIGLLYISGQQKDNHLNTKEMWSPFGASIYRAIMSEVRFRFLINCLRFDDKDLRDREDKFAPVRGLWEKFICQCTASYTPHEYCTIDEQLLSFKGRCPFLVYIPSKPDKYGMKIVCMCDARTYYMLTAISYIGKENRGPNPLQLPTYYAKVLSEPIHGTNRNITLDNWFTSIPLAETMLRDHDLTIIGTLRKNKPEIPVSFQPNNKKEVLSSQFAFDREKTLVSFCPRKGKAVLMISTMHSDKKIDAVSKKPEVVLFYNSTKGGVDSFDQMAHNYTTSRKTRRWPLRHFYGMLHQAGINSQIILVNN